MVEASAQQQAERKLELFLQQVQIPTLPMVAQKLVELCKDEMANFADFARVLETDPGLASRILRVANSAYYAQRNKATTLERAITALGLKHVKSIALGFRLATTMSEMGGEGFDMERFWEESVLRGVIARKLAEHYCPKVKEEAFLVGLLQNVGVPVLVDTLGPGYAAIWKEKTVSEAALAKLEQEVFEFNHQMAAGIVAQQWSLPEILANPIRNHHQKAFGHRSTNEEVQLAQISYFTATLTLRSERSLSEEDLQFTDYCQSVFGMGQRALEDLLKQSQGEFQSISGLFADILPDQIDVADLLTQANAMLSRIACAGPADVQDVEDELMQLRERCMELSKSLNQYQEKVRTDALTGLATRPVLEEYVQKVLPRVKQGKTSLMVVFMDIDHFKTINDVFGHRMGDWFLKELAEMLRGVFSKKGCVARFGGDEIVVALMGADTNQAVMLVKALLTKARMIEQTVEVEGEKKKIAISCSMGMVLCEAGSEPGPWERLVELADHQMYQAKQGGRNRFCFDVIGAKEAESAEGARKTT